MTTANAAKMLAKGEAERMTARCPKWARCVLRFEAGTAPLYAVVGAIGSSYLPDYPRRVGTFATSLHAVNIPEADALTQQYTRLFFEEVGTVEPRAGLLCLIAHNAEGEGPKVEVAALIEKDGALWASVAYDIPIRPDDFRFVRACVGGENPDGILFGGSPECQPERETVAA